jgi:cytochrome c-type biogenesis protein CcmH/NrfG
MTIVKSTDSRRSLRNALLVAVVLLLTCVAVGEHFYLAALGPPWYTMARTDSQRSLYAQASERLELGLASDPGYTPAYELLAECYRMSGDRDRALGAISRLHSIDPGNPHLMLLTTELALTGPGGAVPDHAILDHAREAVIDSPASPRARAVLACALATAGPDQDTAHAIQQLRLAQHLSGSSALATFLRGKTGAEEITTEIPKLLPSITL